MAVLRHAAALLLGLVVALAAVAVHRTMVPLGLVLALAATFAVGGWLLGSRSPRTSASYVAGWLLMFAVVVTGRPEGDFALVQDVPGYSMMLAGVALVVLGLVGLTRGDGRAT